MICGVCEGRLGGRGMDQRLEVFTRLISERFGLRSLPLLGWRVSQVLLRVSRNTDEMFRGGFSK